MEGALGMIITFYLHDVDTGELVEDIVPVLDVITRRNAGGGTTDLSGDVGEPAELGGGLYELEVPDVLFLASSIIDLEIDCTDATAERRLAYHIAADTLPASAPNETVPADFTMKRGDTAPVLERRLLDERGAPLDLSEEGTEVLFRMRVADGGLLKVDDAEAEIVNAKKGHVRYVWAEGDTDLAGTFDAEFIVTYTGEAEPTEIRTLPSSRYYRVEILSTLA